MSMSAPSSDKRTASAAMLFSVTMHAFFLVGFAQYSMRANTARPSPEKQNTYPPIEVMFLTAPVPMLEAPVAKSTANHKPSQSAERKPQLATAQALMQASKPASSNDLRAEPKSSVDIAKHAHADSTPVEASNSASKANAGAGDASLNDGRLTQASTRPVERRSDPEPAQGARPDYAYNPQPDYPMLLREQGVGGVVWLRVWVDSEGYPGEIKLAKGSGYRLLDDAALRAVRQWRFIPGRNGDQKLASWVEFPIRFTLNG